jgi:hypothetical protein
LKHVGLVLTVKGKDNKVCSLILFVVQWLF